MQKGQKQKLSNALVKKALGYEIEEVVEEYIVDKEDKETLILNKKKVTKKSLPPDMSAVKTLLIMQKNKAQASFSSLSDEELKNYKNKLLNELKEQEEKEKKGEINGTRKNKCQGKV